MSTYRVGIVGLRGIAASPAPAAPHTVLGSQAPHSHAACFAEVTSTGVVAVCDLDVSLMQEFIGRWSGTWPGITAYTDYREMLERENLDILSIATSDHRHADIAVDAAEAGVKGIFCEKPLATTLADADRMIAAVERCGVAMTVNHSRRWRPQFHHARQLIRSGEIGRLKRIIANDCQPRSMIFRNGTHMIDMINFLVESNPDWVVAQLDTGLEDYGPHYRGDGGRNAEIEPGATALIHFQNDVVALYCGTKTTNRMSEIDLICEDGRIRILPALLEVETEYGIRRLPWPQYMQSDGVAAIRELITSIECGSDVLSPPQDARKAVEVILAILRSQHLGSSRVDLPLSNDIE